MKRTNTFTRTCLIWALLIGIVGLTPFQSFAQDKKEVVVRKKAKSGDSTSEAIVVEVKDGKVFVDGKEVSDVEAKGRKLRVRRSGNRDSEDAMIWIEGSHDGDSDAEGRFFFKSDDGSDVFERVMDLNSLGDDMAEARILSRFPQKSGRALTFSSKGDAFSVYPNAFASFENGETMKMDMQSRELAMKIRTMDGDTSELESELDALLSKIFASKQESQQNRVDQLRKELEELELKLSDRNANKQDIIAMRKKELLGTSDKYDW